MEDNLTQMKTQYEAALGNIETAANRWSPENINNIMTQLINGYAVISGKPTPQLAGINQNTTTQQNKNTENIFDKKINTELAEMSNKDKAILLQIINKLKKQPSDEQKRITPVPADTPTGDTPEPDDTQ